MATKIRKMRIEIEPAQEIPETVKFRIKIDVVGKQSIGFEQMLPEDDFISFFDMIFDCAKAQIKKHALPKQ